MYERIALCDLQFEIFDLNLEVVCVALLLVKSLKQRKFDLFHTLTKLAGWEEVAEGRCALLMSRAVRVELQCDSPPNRQICLS